MIEEGLMRIIEIESDSELVEFLKEFSGGGGIGIERKDGMYFAVAFRGGKRVRARLQPKLYEQCVEQGLLPKNNPLQIKPYNTQE